MAGLGGGDGIEFHGHFAVYDTYMRDCLLDAGLLDEEIDAIFADNDRLVAYIDGTPGREKKETLEWIATDREKKRMQARARMRKMREKRNGATSMS